MHPDPKSPPNSTPVTKRDVARVPARVENDPPLQPFPATSDVLCVFAFLWAPGSEDK